MKIKISKHVNMKVNEQGKSVNNSMKLEIKESLEGKKERKKKQPAEQATDS